MSADERQRKTEGEKKKTRKAWPRAMESCNRRYVSSRRIKRRGRFYGIKTWEVITMLSKTPLGLLAL